MTFVSKPTTTETGRPRDYRNYIDGAFMPAPGEMIEVLNPATGVLLGRKAFNDDKAQRLQRRIWPR